MAQRGYPPVLRAKWPSIFASVSLAIAHLHPQKYPEAVAALRVGRSVLFQTLPDLQPANVPRVSTLRARGCLVLWPAQTAADQAPLGTGRFPAFRSGL